LKGTITRRMTDIFSVKTKGRIVNSPHFWTIITITLLLILIYQAWPWRYWKFTDGIWQWFPWLSPLHELALVEIMNHIVGILFLLPIIYACLFFSWQGALVTSLLALTAVLPIIVDMWPIDAIITNVTLLLLPFLIISIASFELQRRRKERRIFAEREVERQIYLAGILESQENERRRIAQELHDDTIQALLVIANRAQALIPSGDGDMREVKSNAEWVRDATLQTAEEVRRISLDLRPSVLDDLGLVPALRWLVDRVNKESDINTQILINGVERKLSSQVEITLFRVVQEALNNIKRHSKAKEAVVTVEFTIKSLKVTVEDNGQGFHPPRNFTSFTAEGKLGLIGLQQRINFIDGTFQIHSKPGEGTSLLIKVKS